MQAIWSYPVNFTAKFSHYISTHKTQAKLGGLPTIILHTGTIVAEFSMVHDTHGTRYSALCASPVNLAVALTISPNVP